jgi:hypothetical protein
MGSSSAVTMIHDIATLAKHANLGLVEARAAEHMHVFAYVKISGCDGYDHGTPQNETWRRSRVSG